MTASSAWFNCYAQSVIHRRHPIALDTHTVPCSLLKVVDKNKITIVSPLLLSLLLIILTDSDLVIFTTDSAVLITLRLSGDALGPNRRLLGTCSRPCSTINSLTMFSRLFVLAFRSAFSDIDLDTLTFRVSSSLIVVTIILTSFRSLLLTVAAQDSFLPSFVLEMSFVTILLAQTLLFFSFM